MTGTNSRPIPKIPNLADVLLTSLANGDFLAWDSGSSKWINTVHGTSGDPHTQYLKTDGSRALTGDQSAGSNKITNLGTPSASTDAATKGYVDSVAQGLDVKLSVRVATTANGTLSTAFANGQTVDGVTLATGDRILLKDQSTASQNGIYIVAASGAPARAADLAATSSAAGAFCFVEEGTANADKGFVCTSNVGSDVVGTNNLTWTQFTGAAAGVTSVDLTAPAIFTVSGNPITSSGTIAITLTNQTANYVWAGPTTGSAAAPTFRALVAADLPTIAHSSLSGLTSGDPHTQYALADGTRGTFGARQWLAPVICSTTANVSISGGGIANGTTHDGITVSTGQRILVQFQTTASENGVYVVPASGAASRSTDLPASVLADNVVVVVGRGSLYADWTFQQTANGCTVGTDSQTWQAFPRVTDISAAAVKYGVTYQTFNALTDGATVTIDWSLGNKYKVTLGGSRTFAFSNTTAGQAIRLQIKQDGTGSRTVTWPSGISWFGGSAPTLTTTANKTDEVVLECTAAGSAYDGYLVGTNK